jgi:hypothetical protein
LRHGFAVMRSAGANPLGFVSCKGRTGYEPSIPSEFHQAQQRQKAALGAALGLARGRFVLCEKIVLIHPCGWHCL